MPRLFVALLALFMWPSALSAQTDEPMPATQTQETSALETRAADIVALFNGEVDGGDIFAPAFLEAIPLDQVEALTRQLTDQFGRALGVEAIQPNGEALALVALRMERALGTVNLSIDPADDNRINGLRLLNFAPANDTPTKIATDLEALDGEVSAYFGLLDGDEATLAINPEAQSPLGSAMKLYILGALGEEIAQNKRDWSDVVALDTRSFPSGQMQDWPQNAPVKLHTLASLMISISDNTATDQLIRTLGRKTVEAYMARTGHSAPELNTPWLTTRELFLLKGGAPETLDAFGQGSAEKRQAILDTLERNPADVSQINARLAAGPFAIESAEWFASAPDLAALFRTMRSAADAEVFRIMAINPALPPSVTAKWDYIGFKGGSETGVLNMTWLLRDNTGHDHVLMLSWSNRAKSVNTQTLLLIAQRILSLPLAR